MATYRTGGLSNIRALLKSLITQVIVHAFRVFDRHPLLLRAFTAPLRLKPVWCLGRMVLVTGDRQVREVLARDDDFPIAEQRAAKFLTGSFVLGMSRTAQFQRERAILEHVVKREDRARIETLVDTESARLVNLAKPRRSLDVVSELSTPVGKTLIHEYFGVRDTHDGLLHDHLRKLGAMIASPHSELPTFRRSAEASAVELFTHVSAEIQASAKALVWGNPPPTTTVLQRLVLCSLTSGGTFDAEAVRRNMTGVLLPGSALVTRAFAISVVELFSRRHKALLHVARQAVESGNRAQLQACVLEALRFHPVFAVLPRYAPRDTELPGFKRSYRIKAGSTVLAAVVSAMFDAHSQLFAGPNGGQPAQARIRDRAGYRHFGGGAHECLGQHIALPQLVGMLFALMRLPGLRVEEPIRYHADDGISPESLIVHFDAA